MNGGIKTVETPNLPDVSGGDFRIGDLLVAADQPPIVEPQPPAEQPRYGRHRLDRQLHRADDGAPGRHRLHQQLHRATDPSAGRHRLYQELHGADH
jgi:hypothetical protein